MAAGYARTSSKKLNSTPRVLVPEIGSSFLLCADRRECPWECLDDHVGEIVEKSAERCLLPAAATLGHLHEPQMNGVAAESDVRPRVVLWA